MIDGELDTTDTLPATNIPGLGTVHLRGSLPFGIAMHIHSLVLEADEEDQAAVFANRVLSYLVASPDVSVEQMAQLPSDAVGVLFEHAVVALGIRSEYDGVSVDVAPRARLYLAFNKLMQDSLGELRDAITGLVRNVQPALGRIGKITLGFAEVVGRQIEGLLDPMRGPLSRMLSEYHMRHVFIRCPACGREYAISDPDLQRPDLFEHYEQRRGAHCQVRCDEILPEDLSATLRAVSGDAGKPPCGHSFTLHEGLVEYKAEAPLVWFSRGPYALVEEGVANVRVEQAVRPHLAVPFSWIDHVEVIPRRAEDVSARVHWRRVGAQANQFEMLTSAERDEDIGKPVTLRWRAVGTRQLPEEEDMELWKGYLISSAAKLLYDLDSRMSVLESWMAFDLFVDAFIEEKWQPPHLKGNLDHLWNVAGRSIATTARILLHEALGIHFVGSEVWRDWDWARAFRNQVAHGRRLEDTKYKRRNIGRKFAHDREIAAFCYSAVVRAIYFIRYWDVESEAAQQQAAST